VRKWGIIVSFVLIFAILGTAYFFLTRPDAPEKPAEATGKPVISVLSYAPEQVLQIEIQSRDSRLAFVRDGETWLVKNEPDIEIHAVRVELLCVSAATLSAESLVAGDAKDLHAYGLSSPQAEVKLSLANGETEAILVGDPAPGGDGYYACLASSTDVYLISGSTGNQFLQTLADYRVLTVTALNSMDVRAVSITKNGQVFKLEYEEKAKDDGFSSSWHITSPIIRNADDSLVQEKILTPLCTLIAVDVAADKAEDIHPFGFEGDGVEIRTAHETVRLSVGTADGIDYVMREDKPAVYMMGSGALSFMNIGAFDVLERMTNLISIDTVDTIDITLPGIAATMDVDFEGETMHYFVNDIPADETAFKDMYVELIALEVDGEVVAPVHIDGQKPSASIVFTLTDGSTTTLAYYPYDEFNYAVYENSECTFYMKKTKLTELGEKLRTFVQNTKG